MSPGLPIAMSEPMEDAWSSLLKRETPRTIAGRRRREARQQFRPSTGQFKSPPGGMSGGAGATMRRFKAQMRGIKSGKKTGLMKPHLSVEMSHRGIQTKQPLSKDPQKYTAQDNPRLARFWAMYAHRFHHMHDTVPAPTTLAYGCWTHWWSDARTAWTDGSPRSSSYACASPSYATNERTTTAYTTNDATDAIQRACYASGTHHDE